MILHCHAFTRLQAGPVDTAIQVLAQDKPLGHDCQPASNPPKLAYLVTYAPTPAALIWFVRIFPASRPPHLRFVRRAKDDH